MIASSSSVAVWSRRRPSMPRTPARSSRLRAAGVARRRRAQGRTAHSGRDVERLRSVLAPRRDLLRDSSPGAAQLARTLDAPPRGVGVGAGADALAPFFAFVGRPNEAAHLVEGFHELVVQRQQVLNVGGRVGALLDAQRPARPVGEAVALGEPGAEQLLDGRRQRRRAHPDEARRDLCVEQRASARCRTRVRGSRDPDRRRARPCSPGPASTSPSGSGRRSADRRARCPPGHAIWIEREVRPVRALAVELGVERVTGFVGERPDELGQLRRSIDPEGFHGASLPRARPTVVLPGERPSSAAQARPARTLASCSNDRSTAPWSSARWRTMTSVQPSTPSAAKASRTWLGPPTTIADGSKPR